MKNLIIFLAIFLMNPLWADHHETSTGDAAASTSSFLDGIGANVTLTSDYIWRGAVQNNKKAAVQGGLDYAHDSGIAVGMWGSNVNGGTEIDFYSSYAINVNEDVSISSGFTFYHYIYGEDVSNVDTLEFNLALSIDGINLSANYGEDYFNSDSSYWYFNLVKDFEIAKNLTFGINIGYNLFDDEDKAGDNYFHYVASLSKSLNDFTIGAHYADAVDRDYEVGKTVDRSFYITLDYSL